MNIAEQDRMFLSMIDRIFPDQEYTNDEDSVCFRQKNFFHGSVLHQKYIRTREFPGGILITQLFSKTMCIP